MKLPASFGIILPGNDRANHAAVSSVQSFSIFERINADHQNYGIYEFAYFLYCRPMQHCLPPMRVSMASPISFFSGVHFSWFNCHRPNLHDPGGNFPPYWKSLGHMLYGQCIYDCYLHSKPVDCSNYLFIAHKPETAPP
jgi:hypothetical protein